MILSVHSAANSLTGTVARILLASALLVWGGVQAAPAQDPWLEACLAHASTQGDEALTELVQALQPLDVDFFRTRGEAIREVIAAGWEGDQSQIESLLSSHGQVLSRLANVAAQESIAFAPVGNQRMVLPPVARLRAMTQLQLLAARRAQARGDAEAAVDRLIQAVRLADHLMAEGVPVAQHTVAIDCMDLALRPAPSILADPRLPDEILAQAAEEFARLDEGRVLIVSALRAEAGPNLVSLGLPFSHERRRISALTTQGHLTEAQLREPARAIFSPWASFEAEHRRVWSELGDRLDRPAWERPELVDEWLETETPPGIHRLAVPQISAAVVRNDVVVARLRLCRALCALRLGDDVEFVDPFDGAPLRVDGDRIWSIGPDGVDQGGAVAYDPAQGLLSAGDIVVARASSSGGP